MRSTLARVVGVHTEERAWRIGADGEELVAARLEKVVRKDPRWRVLHAIPVGTRGSDIDHLVLGPGGVFTINTKHHPRAKVWVSGDTFMVDGHKQPYIRNSRHEAKRASALLEAASGVPVRVEGLVVTVNATDLVVKNQPKGVHVTWRRNLSSWLLALGDILDEPTVTALYDAARRSTTWRP
ncbi:NERD domain-containing protein [Nocardioides sp. CBS4Y-1]|uniref:NERD domain-containing protein n=1 Tax=Nocardioides acrostichi TaxID=2784339 RepID=A0A930UZ28_9ACTN|nr:NERD domain-containing protein [Nocardioides acrostichi]